MELYDEELGQETFLAVSIRWLRPLDADGTGAGGEW